LPIYASIAACTCRGYLWSRPVAEQDLERVRGEVAQRAQDLRSIFEVEQSILERNGAIGITSA
jgi:hypothetical protein